MGKPHKHRDLIRAWSDGAKIQMKRFDGDWVDVLGNTPDWNTSVEYRIKPEPVVLYVNEYDNNEIGAMHYASRELAEKYIDDGYIRTIKLMEVEDEA